MIVGYVYEILLGILAVSIIVVIILNRQGRITITDRRIQVLGAIGSVATVFALIIPLVQKESPGARVIRIVNELDRPIEITIEGDPRAKINPGDTKNYEINSFPAYVEWTTQPTLSSAGTKVGGNLSGIWTGVDNDTTIRVDHIVDDQPYFYLKAYNKINTDCSYIIDYGLSTEYRPNENIKIKPGVVTNLGYYKLNDKSNVYFYCEDRQTPFYWYSYPPGPRIGDILTGEIESPSGVLLLTIDED